MRVRRLEVATMAGMGRRRRRGVEGWRRRRARRSRGGVENIREASGGRGSGGLGKLFSRPREGVVFLVRDRRLVSSVAAGLARATIETRSTCLDQSSD